MTLQTSFGCRSVGFADWRRSRRRPSSIRRGQITIVVPIGAGGGVDATGRLIAEKLQERLKQPVVVENRPAGGGMVGADSVAKAAPDGHTLLVMESSAVLHKWLHKDVPYDVVADFAPVAQVATSPLMLFAAALVCAERHQGVDRARQGAARQALGRHARRRHAASSRADDDERARQGGDRATVPYRGAALSLNDLLAGQIPMIWAAPTAVMPHVAAGKVKILGVASAAAAAVAAAGADRRRERRAGL